MVSNKLLARLRSISGDIKTTAAGIYMHILWPRMIPSILPITMIDYIAENLPAFIITFRIYKTCVLGSLYLRYLTIETMSTELVRDVDGLSKDFDTYLPPSTDRSSAGRYLNVVPPIWQRSHNEDLPARKEVFDRAGFEALIRSDNPIVRSWARQAIASYNDLRNSPDP
ncbi:hypothetical protein N7516_008582 [Penicillium verrucosum]|uniref:uncharacterized protein n=1 Tax=Penicillium verrucosum TaxID=60171 RepID=UPI0025458F64|nr:uncharacterized protein N7516_008582 [Penicillium verrucosum]KAJ5926809.1 hypothetical protein N7516_008582 [Penicillium verrucosum]